ncbi:formimidoylglutamase [Vibrio sp. vnigr-6D03]|uniref:formimidoylglutamase n=1 Tax=Vibrio sp. vnigr-6D03 TaxID=2058088 RepID=UPI001EFF9B67|nr:formimidoylglutamase [Vibrio sp. vnigr-6D03]
MSKQRFEWQGRNDIEDGELGHRVHHVIRHGTPNNANLGDVTILGFACDAGVARNKGRTGAQAAPNKIREALANMAWHETTQLFDGGTVVCEGDQLEQSQHALADVLSSTLKHTPAVTLGGGHEIAWASFLGLAKFLIKEQKQKEQSDPSKDVSPPRVGIINFDAHFDLRVFDSNGLDFNSSELSGSELSGSELTTAKESIQPSSGTPFNQIHQYCQKQGWAFNYACLGVSAASNTKALFKRADNLGVWYVEDTQMHAGTLAKQLTQLQRFIDQNDVIYLTIDLDVFPAATAPGVSAPAAKGVSMETFSPYFSLILNNYKKLKIADIAEYNPRFDIDGQTARLAARLCWDIATSMSRNQS